MISRIRFMFAETGQNIWRNLALTLASILVATVSLALFGGSQLVARGVDNATQRWEGGIEFVVFMKADAEQSQLDEISTLLADSEGRGVDEWTFVTQEETFAEFTEFFAGDEELLQTISVETMPPSFRIRPTNRDAGAVEALGGTFESRPGVRTVVFASEVIREIQDNAENISRWLLFASFCLLLASAIVILTTLSIAIASRRNEIEIMKLVGASNWFIRVPFVIEGMIQGIIGSLLAVPILWGIRTYVIEDFSRSDTLRLLEGFRVTDPEFLTISLLVIVLGTGVAVLGSVIAVSRYLSV